MTKDALLRWMEYHQNRLRGWGNANEGNDQEHTQEEEDETGSPIVDKQSWSDQNELSELSPIVITMCLRQKSPWKWLGPIPDLVLEVQSTSNKNGERGVFNMHVSRGYVNQERWGIVVTMWLLIKSYCLQLTDTLFPKVLCNKQVNETSSVVQVWRHAQYWGMRTR
jgi:hypothetical protein